MEEDDSPEGLLLSLDEVEKFRREIINKYEKKASKKQMELLKKKIEIVEDDIKKKLMAYRLTKITKVVNKNNHIEEDYEEKRSHTR